MIPNYIHFIFFGFTEFTQTHYWSIKSAAAVHQNKKIFLHYTQAPKNNPLWNEIVHLVDLVYIDPPTELNGVLLESYQYKADVARLQILIKHGGIYMDIDVISLKPFDNLLHHTCVLGIEDADNTSISNAVILSKPNHPFIVEWLEQTGHNLQDRAWAYHGVCLPKEILDSGTWDVHVEPRESFMPFDFRDEYVFGTVADDRLATSYTMHLWETIWWDKLNSVDSNSVLAQICRPYKKKLKIAIYTICKNEQHNVLAWAQTNTEADYRLVCDTGSTDDTVKLLTEQGITVVPIAVIPWRFDHARGTSLNLLPDDIDVCIWQDLDERLLPGWYDEIQQHWTSDTTMANHKYRNNQNPWQWHSKIHRRHGCHWEGAVHEELRWHMPEHTIWLPNVYLDEHQDVTKDRRGYFELLKKKVAEGNHNWRTYYFLANEYAAQGQSALSIDTRIKSYHACKDGDTVKSYVAKHIAGGYDAANDRVSAERWYKIAVDHGDERESWFAYAEHAMRWKDWETAFLAAKHCLSCTVRRNGFTQDPRVWSEAAYDVAALAAHNIGLHKQAIEWGQQAVSMNPRDDRLKKNLDFYEETVVIPFPEVLEIETSGDCNRTCGACIRNSHPDRAQVHSWFEGNLMPMEKIKLIFDQARVMGPGTRLGLSHYNEPLMDPRFVDILKLAKTYSFKYIFFHSNGDLVTPELAAEIDGLADWIMFSVYSVGPARDKRQQQLMSWFKKTQVRFTTGKLGLTHFGPTDQLEQIIQSVKHLPCHEPQDRFIINHQGKMEFCCEDLGGNFDLGSVSEQVTLHDLWFNPRFQQLAKRVNHPGGRQGIPYCENCPSPHEQLFKAKNIKVVEYEPS